LDCYSAHHLELTQQEHLRAFDRDLDLFFGGGLPLSSFIECGFPMGREGRRILLPFLTNASRGLQYNAAFVLWVNGYDNLEVFAPAWFARGLAPDKTVFAQSSDVLVELKQVFLNPLFKVIVIDSPQFFSSADCLFLRRMAKKNRQVILLLRNYFLTNKKGNIACALRFNAWCEHTHEVMVLQAVKGFGSRTKMVWPKGFF